MPWSKTSWQIHPIPCVLGLPWNCVLEQNGLVEQSSVKKWHKVAYGIKLDNRGLLPYIKILVSSGNSNFPHKTSEFQQHTNKRTCNPDICITKCAAENKTRIYAKGEGSKHEETKTSITEQHSANNLNSVGTGIGLTKTGTRHTHKSASLTFH